MGISQFATAALAMNNAPGEPAWGVVVFTGLTLVFAVLILLYLMVVVEGVIFTAIDKKKAERTALQNTAPARPAPEPPAVSPVPAVPPRVEEGIPAEVVAAIAAAVACMEDGSHYTVRSIRRAKPGRSAWAQAGVVSYTQPF